MVLWSAMFAALGFYFGAGETEWEGIDAEGTNCFALPFL